MERLRNDNLGKFKIINFRQRATLLWRALAFVLFASSLMAASTSTTDHLTVEIMSEVGEVTAAKPFTIALKFDIVDEWHLYWSNPGDAGLAPRVRWKLPEGFEAGDLQFPPPERIPAGPLVSYGYAHELVLLVDIFPPDSLAPGQQIELQANIDWLVCRVECVPEEAVLFVELVSAAESKANAEITAFIAETRTELPCVYDAWSVIAEKKADSLIIIGGTELSRPVPDSIIFFPEQKGVIENAARQKLTTTDDGFRISIPRNPMYTGTLDSISGMLVSPTGWGEDAESRALLIASIFESEVEAVTTAETRSGGGIGLIEALLFAFIGGVILNLMPCVLPILSIKILGFVQQAHHDRRETFVHSLGFLAGVLATFWALAGVLLLLQAGGEQLGWGFQLQSPAFLIVLAAFMFLLGLNLFGVFEVGATLTGFGSGGRRSGMVGSFVTGITATVVATPCTAPFMGAALGFSLTQPPIASLAIFTLLGIGMAAPFVLVTNVPRLVKFLPKPGRWMETMKQFMGFLLMATVIWLAWVLGVQRGPDLVIFLLGALLFVALGAWILGRWGGLAKGLTTRSTARLISAALIIGVVSMTAINAETSIITPPSTAIDGKITWEPYTQERIESSRADGRPLLIDFTAAWCLSCKVNERVAFGANEVQNKLLEKNVITIKADWTNRSDEITQALAAFGRNSVPLYVLYTGDSTEDPIVLPEILTPRIVLDALEKI